MYVLCFYSGLSFDKFFYAISPRRKHFRFLFLYVYVHYLWLLCSFCSLFNSFRISLTMFALFTVICHLSLCAQPERFICLITLFLLPYEFIQCLNECNYFIHFISCSTMHYCICVFSLSHFCCVFVATATAKNALSL